MAATFRDPFKSSHQPDAVTAYRIGSVVAPLDASSSSQVVLPVARVLAHLAQVTLHVVYVGERPDPRPSSELGLSDRELQNVVLDQLAGDPATAIVNFSRECPSPWIVMSTQIAGGQPEAVFGPTAEAVLNAVGSPLILVTPDRGDRPWELRRIVLAHDGTPTCYRTVAPAGVDLWNCARPEVLVLHVAARKSHPTLEPGSLPAPLYLDQPHHEWPAWASEFMERMMALGALPASVNFKLLVTGGQPGSEIAQFASDNHASLVILALHGYLQTERAGMLQAVVQRSGCPVLLMCTAQREPGSGVAA